MDEVVVGVDEVGRGPLAGPLVACAVALPLKLRFRGIKDSKLLSKSQREQIIDRILPKAVGIGIGWVEPALVDEYGLTVATRLAMTQAMRMIACQYQAVIIDGSYNFLKADYPLSQAIIKADQTHQAVMAAAIVAKVSRDRYMAQMAKLYPAYGFERHVGYGTKVHKSSLLTHGPCPLHRLSFAPVGALD